MFFNDLAKEYKNNSNLEFCSINFDYNSVEYRYFKTFPAYLLIKENGEILEY